MKIVMTGGHLSPMLAVIESLDKGSQVFVVGRKYPLEGDSTISLEYQELTSRHVFFEEITAGRMQRKFTKHTVWSLFKFPYGLFQSFLILKNIQPDVVLSFGGYISLPVTMASVILRIPIVIHEQTLQAGLANRITALFAKKICISWQSSEKFFPKGKTVLTGNPLRKFTISKLKLEGLIENEKLPLIYITGGSVGSHAVNVLIEGCLEKLLKNFRILHQTGDSSIFKDFNRLNNLRETFDSKLRKRYSVCKFVKPQDVGSIMTVSSIVVSRSGINTVSELMYFGKPSLLIPLPYSQGNEQVENALFLKSVGLAEVLFQDKLTSDILYEKIINMAQHLFNYQKFSVLAKKLLKKDGADRIISVVKREVTEKY